MKKLFTVLAVCFALAASTKAQNALGLRIGGGTAFGVEATYQKELSKLNRFEADLGLENSGMGVSALYQWVWDLKSISEGVKWYAGFGGGLNLNKNSAVGVLGQIGIEYTLIEIPLQFSLDARPGFYSNGFGGGAALSIRYKF